MRQLATVLLLTVLTVAAQTKSFVGTVTGFRSASAEVEIRPDSGDMVVARFTAGTIAQKIAPGERDLKKAATIQVTDVTAGDRVLVTLEAGSTTVRRIVVMPAGDIAKRNEADRLDWQKRGVAGIVSARTASRITVKTRTLSGEIEAVVTVDEHTNFKRYAPDSVKFSDAQASTLSAVNVGDQLRARGEKSEDGLKVAASEVVFGTFVVKAGSISAVDSASGQIVVKELGSNKPLTVVFTADSQIKQMPAFPAGTMGGMARGGRSGATPMGGRAGGFDINQMLEMMPAVKIEDLKPGSTVVISSTKGAKSDQLTAIMVLSNADMLIQMASAMSGSGSRGGSGMGAGMGSMMGGDAGGLSGLGLSGIMQ